MRRAGPASSAIGLGLSILLLIPLLFSTQVQASIASDLKIYDDHVKEMQSSFAKVPANLHDKTWVKAKLQHMVDVDQYMRKFPEVTYTNHYSDADRKEFMLQFMSRWTSVDRADTADLKDLLKIYGWFKISDFGAPVDGNAWLLVQHADLDPKFQEEILKILEPLVNSGETKPANYAYLFDRVAVARKTPQRYGSQGHCTGPGAWEPDPIEEPAAGLDARRKSVGLPSEAEYIAVFKDICH